jgi:hypothetical protein
VCYLAADAKPRAPKAVDVPARMLLCTGLVRTCVAPRESGSPDSSTEGEHAVSSHAGLTAYTGVALSGLLHDWRLGALQTVLADRHALPEEARLEDHGTACNPTLVEMRRH